LDPNVELLERFSRVKLVLYFRAKIEESEFGGQTVHSGVGSGNYEFASHGGG
jgi:hypothetical protein